ncbi:ferredoxin reductase family protein [Celerinatantimonas yamalensis]|uniref:Ferric reductase-like transmembrane domain-containing protein n=1 Tax=Celerinatantimonas yamalensis TaxID=559956 RepID=A0ABW9G5D1_9GAMM
MKTMLLMMTLLWLPTVLLGYSAEVGFFFWWHHLTILTGMIGLTCMTLSMILALRLSWVEAKVKGLDNGYALHKQIGIGALIALVLHWTIIESHKWFISLGWIERFHRHQHAFVPGINWTHLSKIVGEYTFYVFVIFAAISLIQLVSYRHFRFIHKIAGALFIAGAFHSITIMDLNWPAAAMDMAIMMMSVAGVLAAMLSFSGRIGLSKRVSGHIIGAEVIEPLQVKPPVLHLKIALDHEMDYHSGQFAFLNFHDGEAAHPFSVLHYDQSAQTIEFAIKALGDYTTHLVSSFDTLHQVSVEGGYGRFYIPPEPRQVWIAAGVGVVPFIAWLYVMARSDKYQRNNVELYYCHRSHSETYFTQIIEKLICDLPSVNLHVISDDLGEVLQGEQIAKVVSLREVSVSFSGPMKFGQLLARQLQRYGLVAEQFHYERFMMR